MAKYVDVGNERDVFNAAERHGELWSAIDRAHGFDIDEKVARLPSDEMLVLLTMQEFKATPPAWREFTITYPSNQSDFWTDFHNAIREEFEIDTDRALNVQVVTVAPILPKPEPKPKRKKKKVSKKSKKSKRPKSAKRKRAKRRRKGRR